MIPEDWLLLSIHRWQSVDRVSIAKRKTFGALPDRRVRCTIAQFQDCRVLEYLDMAVPLTSEKEEGTCRSLSLRGLPGYFHKFLDLTIKKALSMPPSSVHGKGRSEQDPAGSTQAIHKSQSNLSDVQRVHPRRIVQARILFSSYRNLFGRMAWKRSRPVVPYPIQSRVDD